MPSLTLKQLLDEASGRSLSQISADSQPSAISEHIPFPFFAIVGQQEMKLALLLNIVNPAAGGVLLVGPRGTGKTSAVRSLQDLLPYEQRSLCYYGCTEQDMESGGMDAVCPQCAKKYGQGEPLTQPSKVRLVELPLNVKLEDVLGGKESQENAQGYRLRNGILSQADHNILYIDEVNLLPREIVDAILDAAAQGFFNVRRGFHSATHNSRFILIGSMNPEEGVLRPQILDRFGLRVFVGGLSNPEERLKAYQHATAFRADPRAFVKEFLPITQAAQTEIIAARARVKNIQLPNDLAQDSIKAIRSLGIDSLRAEISWFESAKAHAACDDRLEVTREDLRVVAPMCLRLRRSQFMTDYFNHQNLEEQELNSVLR